MSLVKTEWQNGQNGIAWYCMKKKLIIIIKKSNNLLLRNVELIVSLMKNEIYKMYNNMAYSKKLHYFINCLVYQKFINF